MGKWTDKLYITHSEWSNAHSEGGLNFGGASSKKSKSAFKKLPFHACALTLQSFSDPVCTRDGVVFDRENILHWLKENKSINPVTGAPLDPSDLITLHFHKNQDDVYHCPITRKEFTDASHIVAIATTGNVYSYEAVKQLNIDAKHWKDLLDDDAALFTRRDIIVIQDPQDVSKRNFEDFWFLKHRAEFERPNSAQQSMNLSGLATKVLQEMASTKVEPVRGVVTTAQVQAAAAAKAAKGNASEFKANTAASTGRLAAAFTSTAMDVHTDSERVELKDDEFMYREFVKEVAEARKNPPKGKKGGKVDQGHGYVQLKTNIGDLNLELYCAQTPQTSHNFLSLCSSGYYDGVSFHRSIPGFMIQGGDPTGSGKGGKSCWGGEFKDEIRPNLSHNARGLLCMANRGKNTNTSQFFITYAPCAHLDGKHTIFGRLVGGLDVLSKMESLATNDQDRPLAPITITRAVVFVDPFADWRKRYAERVAKAAEQPKSRQEQLALEGTWLGSLNAAGSAGSSDAPVVGKYLKQQLAASKSRSAVTSLFGPVKRAAGKGEPEGGKPKKAARQGEASFESWS